jgi:hypothetical protein
MATTRKPLTVRLRADTHAILELLEQDTGLTRTGVLELAVRDLARARAVRPSTLEAGGPRVEVTAAHRPSLRGILKGAPGGSEDLMRHSSAEEEREFQQLGEP